MSHFTDPSHRRRSKQHTCHSSPAAWLKCRHCGGEFSLNAPGTRHRNHCPWCLWSIHLDDKPGDRNSDCHGGMEPIAVSACPDGEWLIVHQCKTCFVVHINRIAGDDSERELLGLAVRPLKLSPFPI
ncbi:RNHCP domain-containing protein [Ereboglobus sp. PH5-10]|uniref:RNHCP domain-containing protein n=1 Tax=Ereboglobus sp. PH5-10 TaxID=2940629 RepID=UPI00240509F3|nr:RNHCP domain-containing protein [Ereboglobus sp. PH5-10]